LAENIRQNDLSDDLVYAGYVAKLLKPAFPRHPSAEDMLKLVQYGKAHMVVGYTDPSSARYQRCAAQGRWRSLGA
jgi:hypothetical protein